MFRNPRDILSGEMFLCITDFVTSIQGIKNTVLA
jgi:hypothetical protein